MINDCERAQGIYGSRFRRVLMPFLMMSFYLTAMLMLSWQVTLCLFGASAILLVINGLFIEPMQRVSWEMSTINVSIAERISNILSGIEQIKIFSLKSVMVEQYIKENEKYRKEQNKRNFMSASLDGLNQIFELLGSLVFIAVGLVMVSQGITTVDRLAAVYLLYGSMSWNLLQVGLYIPSMANYLANAKRVFEFLDMEEEPERYESVSAISFQGDAEISIRDVTFSYDGRQDVLQHFNLDIPKGKCVALKAESGKGKSTIAKLILGLYPVKEGKIFIKGKAYEEYPLAEVRQLIGYVPQEPYLYDVSVAENIRYGRPGASQEDIINAAKLANAHDFIMELKDGYETRVGERGNLLSGGQRQRVAIARAIINEPRVVLLDEPLSALDLKLRTDMQYELRELQQRLGITFVFVTHDQEEALAMSDWIFVMNEGEIVQSGTPVDIYDEPINHFVATFIGESNILDGRMIEDYLVEFNGKRFEAVDGGMRPNEPVEVVIRPEDLQITLPEEGKLQVKVDTQLFRGVHYEIIAYDDLGNEWMIHSTRKAIVGEVIGLDFEPEDIHVMRLNETEEEFDARIEEYVEVEEQEAGLINAIEEERDEENNL